MDDISSSRPLRACRAFRLAIDMFQDRKRGRWGIGRGEGLKDGIEGGAMVSQKWIWSLTTDDY